MEKIHIINEFKDIQSVAVESNLAYSFRIKIFRKVIKLLRNISKYLDFSDVDRLEELNENNKEPKFHNLCLSYNLLVKATQSLSQPSEPLNDNWNLKWNDFLISLQNLKKEFESLN